MKQKAHPRYRMLRLMLPLFLFIFGCFTPTPPPPTGPTPDEANVAILGDIDHLAPGSQASFLVQPRAPYSMQRWPDACSCQGGRARTRRGVRVRSMDQKGPQR